MTPSADSLSKRIKLHYDRTGLDRLILDALAASGKDVDRLRPEDLAPVDEFHVRGREATLALGRAAGLRAKMSVLDVGCGIGGPSRCLAEAFGCRVTGVDLAGEYCRVAAVLAERVSLSRQVIYCRCDALELPFPEAGFDAVWSQHAAMNIPDKARLYREMYRVLKPGGVLAIHDVLAGDAGPVVFPVPWARTAGTSFLADAETLRGFIEAAGFIIRRREDTTAIALRWFAEMAGRRRRGGPPRLTPRLLLGAGMDEALANVRCNLQEGRISLVQLIAEKN